MTVTATRRIGRETSPVTFRSKLLELMDAKGWSVSDLAQAASLSFPTVRSYTSRGKNARLPNLHNAFRLAEALGVSVEVFRECEDFLKDE